MEIFDVTEILDGLLHIFKGVCVILLPIIVWLLIFALANALDDREEEDNDKI